MHIRTVFCYTLLGRVFLLDEQKRGTWSDSQAERLLRAVLKFARQKGGSFGGMLGL